MPWKISVTGSMNICVYFLSLVEHKESHKSPKYVTWDLGCLVLSISYKYSYVIWIVQLSKVRVNGNLQGNIESVPILFWQSLLPREVTFLKKWWLFLFIYVYVIIYLLYLFFFFFQQAILPMMLGLPGLNGPLALLPVATGFSKEAALVTESTIFVKAPQCRHGYVICKNVIRDVSIQILYIVDRCYLFLLCPSILNTRKLIYFRLV